MTFYLQTGDVLTLMGLSVGMGIALIVVSQAFKARSIGYIAQGYVKVPGGLSQVFRKNVPVGAEAFTIGKDRQFIVDPAFSTTRESWNHWGGNHPVIRYYVDDSRPMSNSLFSDDNVKVLSKGKVGKEAVRPSADIQFERHQKPASATVDLIIRRKGLAVMIEATKKVAVNPLLVGVMVGIASFALSALIFQLWHPGLVPNPPAGYYYRTEPIPQNVTVVH